MKWLAALLLLLSAMPANAEDSSMPITEVHRAITSQPIWLNTSRALTPEDLKGRIVLLDFWTLGCINCMDIIPDLKYREQTFGDKLTVIGVHSAKFANEKDTVNIRNAVLRYGLVHPVVNDADFLIWKKFGVRAWPTLILISPTGLVTSVYAGEGNRDALEADIHTLIKKYDDKIVTSALPLLPESSKQAKMELNFPAKIIAQDNEHLIIADSGHNRILVTDLQGALQQTIGNGTQGLKDGNFVQAEFFNPHGMAYKDGALYVADLGNHALRLVDLKQQRVTTLAGTGEQGHRLGQGETGDAKTAPSSPWDVAFFPDENHLAIAMAGTHQLWSYDIQGHTFSLLAGNGQEAIDDGKLPGNSLSQPSGLFAAGNLLYFTDAESSALRVIDKNGVIKTLIGKGLFDFGYKEGMRDQALLQHCSGLTGDAENLYIADTYNHSVRRYSIKDGTLYNYAGHDLRGKIDGALAQANFNEPGGITRIGERLYVADTNNHLIRVIDMKVGTVSTLDVAPKAPKMPELGTLNDNLPNLQKLSFAVVRNAAIDVILELKPGWHINYDAPSELGLYIQADTNMRKQVFTKEQLRGGHITLPKLTDDYTHRLRGTLYYCADAKSSLCMIKSFDVTLTPTGGEKQITLPVY